MIEFIEDNRDVSVLNLYNYVGNIMFCDVNRIHS